MNACFISYRHGQYDLMKQFTLDFSAALRAELEPMLGSAAVFLDTDRLRGGNLYNEAIARNLYESATMVMVYTPTYFDPENTWCAREFAAMEALEQDRLGRLGVSSSDCGLVIPVVLRGIRHIPAHIRNKRHCYDFECFQLGGRRLSRHPRFAPAIRDIAGYIYDRYRQLSTLPNDIFGAADRFSLPGEPEILPFVRGVATYRMAFPRDSFPESGAALWARS